MSVGKKMWDRASGRQKWNKHGPRVQVQWESLICMRVCSCVLVSVCARKTDSYINQIQYNQEYLYPTGYFCSCQGMWENCSSSVNLKKIEINMHAC